MQTTVAVSTPSVHTCPQTPLFEGRMMSVRQHESELAAGWHDNANEVLVKQQK